VRRGAEDDLIGYCGLIVVRAPSLRVLERLGFHRDHVDPDDGRGEVVWLTRTLP
jgi:hypothetical protein